MLDSGTRMQDRLGSERRLVTRVPSDIPSKSKPAKAQSADDN